ncbi:hypothetical protein ACFYY9_14305 [Streptomyces nigra]|uniref:DUF7144 family membrane protein n=1 Tax=Streptomyces TaxID=1883 RepID=UPI0006E31CA4|nr:hypothetical protein [Streptomyces sp. JHA19]
MTQQQSQAHATDAAHSTAGPSASRAASPSYAPRRPSGGLTGALVFAGVLMLVDGVLAILQGISALAADDVYARVGDYVFKGSLTTWGWVLLALGVVAVSVGHGILRGAWWARLTGIFLASLGMVAHFLFLPYAPVWSVIMVAVDFFVIMALALAPDPT